MFRQRLFVVYCDKKDEWRWRSVEKSNGKTTADSGEGYKNKAHAIKMARSYMSKMFDSLVVKEKS